MLNLYIYSYIKKKKRIYILIIIENFYLIKINYTKYKYICNMKNIYLFFYFKFRIILFFKK